MSLGRRWPAHELRVLATYSNYNRMFVLNMILELVLPILVSTEVRLDINNSFDTGTLHYCLKTLRVTNVSLFHTNVRTVSIKFFTRSYGFKVLNYFTKAT